MSYDLSLYPRPNAKPLTLEAMREFFEEHNHYNTGESHANYNNELTGVYFNFTLSEGYEAEEDEEYEPEEWEKQPHFFFNMNFFRPSFFGLEAAEELEALVKEFDLIVSDPQSDGMDEGEFSTEGFLRGWNKGNQFASSAFGAMGETMIGQAVPVPSATLAKVWQWCYLRDYFGGELFEDEGIDVFVPRIYFVRPEDEVKTLCIWPELIPSAVPETDLVVISRGGLLGLSEEEQKSHPEAQALVTWDELRAVTSDFEVDESEDPYPINYLLLDYGSPENAPEALAEWVRGLSGFQGDLKGVAMEEVVGAELFVGDQE